MPLSKHAACLKRIAGEIADCLRTFAGERRFQWTGGTEDVPNLETWRLLAMNELR